MSLWLGAVALGLGFAAMCFGVYLSFRILNFPDLTIDGSFALGGATSATLIALGWDAWPSLMPALLLGAAAGATTGLLTTRLRVNGLLASILVMIGLYSVNLRIMGRSNQPLLGVDVITTWPGQLAGEANLGAIGRLGQAGCGRGARPRLRRHRLPDRTAGRQDPEGDGGQGHPDRAAEEGLPGRQHRRRDGAEGQAAGRAAEPGAGEVRQDHPQAMSSRLRVGVAGCGAVAQIMHLPHLRELDDLYELVALADVSPEVLELVGEHFGVEPRHRHRSLAELLAGPVDAVLILTPGSHGRACVDAAAAGKHIFVEKPLAFTMRELDEVAAAVERAGVTLQVGYMKRYDPAYRRARPLVRAIDDLRYGQVTTVHPASELFWEHQPIRRQRGQPARHPYAPPPYPPLALESAVSEGHDARLLREALGANAPAAQLGAFNVMLSSLCHDVNALRGLIGEPARVVSCEVWQRGGCVSTVLAYGDDLRVSYSFVYLPNLRSYREELAFFGASERVRIVFPSPFLRNMPTELFHERSDDGAAAETRAIVSYEEAFEEELRAFHRNVTERLRPETDVEDSRGDLRVLTEMAKKAF